MTLRSPQEWRDDYFDPDAGSDKHVRGLFSKVEELVEAVRAEAVEHFARECAAKLRDIARGLEQTGKSFMAAQSRSHADIVEALAKGGVK